MKRSVVVIKDEATLPQVLTAEARKALFERLDVLQSTLGMWYQAANYPCAATMAEGLDNRFREKLKEIPDDAPPKAQWLELKQSLDAEAREVLLEAPCKPPDPPPGKPPTPPTPEELARLAAAKTVYDSYRALVEPPAPLKASGTFSYENVPLQGLGLVGLVGVITSPDNSDRVKLSGNNVLVKNPLNQVMGGIGVNIHFRRFDPRSEMPTPAEKWRAFVGACFTPEFGVVGGLGYGVLRNLSVNAGIGALRIDALRDDDKVGLAPKDADRPFREKAERIVFFALGFNF